MADYTQLLSQFLYDRLAKIGLGGGSASGVLSQNTTSYTTSGTSEEDAWTYTLPANTLAVNGRKIRISAWGAIAANGNSKTIKPYFNGVALISYTTTASGSAWRAQWEITRLGVGSQQYNVYAQASNSAAIINGSAASADETAGIVIKLSITTGTSAGDLSFKEATVEILN